MYQDITFYTHYNYLQDYKCPVSLINVQSLYIHVYIVVHSRFQTSITEFDLFNNFVIMHNSNWLSVVFAVSVPVLYSN